MTRLHYTLADAKRWGAFSGDDNPIHFDLAAARAMGGESLSVHGMRALLDVKQDAQRRLPSSLSNTEGYLKCLVRLRQPLWCDTDWLLASGVAKNRVLSAATVSDPQNDEVCLSCQMSLVAEPESLVDKQPSALSPETVLALQSQFNDSWPDLAQWQFLDALLFRQLISDKALLRQESIAALLGPEDISLQDIFARYPVLQTHQEVVFDARLAQKRPLIDPESLSLWLLPSLVVGQVETGAVVRIAAAAQQENMIMTNVVTLKIGQVTN
ncbi:MaoC family dehydratase [uncultured Cedecea sp.]|uniref:MaoC family dehydratase n=1 Tax=uncultured Cedecea sp. TaxID=988762 RepID=UPI002609C13F|nr:MaoC family dehydratase [uncultured Cedecea sp.]